MKSKQRENLLKYLKYTAGIKNEITAKKSNDDSIRNNKLKLKNKDHSLLRNFFTKTQELSPYQKIKHLIKNKNDYSVNNFKYEIKDIYFNSFNTISNKKDKGTQKNLIDNNIIGKIPKNISLIPKKSKIWNIKVKTSFESKNTKNINNIKNLNENSKNSKNISFNAHEKDGSSFDYCLSLKRNKMLKKNSSQIINIYSYLDNKSNRKKIIKQNIINLFSRNKINMNYKDFEISKIPSRALSNKNNKRIINKFKNKYNNNCIENSIKSLDNCKKKNFLEELNSINQKINTKLKYNNQFSFRNSYISGHNKNWKTAVLDNIIRNIRDICKDSDKLEHHRNNISIYTVLSLNKKE